MYMCTTHTHSEFWETTATATAPASASSYKMARKGEFSFSRYSHVSNARCTTAITTATTLRFTEIVVLQTTNIEYNPKSTNTFYIFLYLSSLLFIFRHSVFPRLFFLILRAILYKSNPTQSPSSYDPLSVISYSFAHFSSKHA